MPLREELFGWAGVTSASISRATATITTASEALRARAGEPVGDAFTWLKRLCPDAIVEAIRAQKDTTSTWEFSTPDHRWHQVTTRLHEHTLELVFVESRDGARVRLAAALQATKTGIWEVDLETGLVTLDARCFELWDLDPAGGPNIELARSRVHQEDRARLASAYRLAQEPNGHGVFDLEYRYFRPTGQLRWIAATGTCVFAGPTPKRFIGTLCDVTARRDLEEQRLSVERRYRQLVEALSESVGVLDAKGTITFVNPAYVKLFGYERPEELVGQHIETLIFPEDREPQREEWQAHLARGGDVLRAVRRFRARDGSERWVNLASTVIPELGPAAPAGILGVMVDLTESRKLEARVQRAQQLESLTVMAGGIAHDFNNLLVGVLANAGFVRSVVPETSPAAQAVDDIEAAATRAAELTRQLQAFAGRSRLVTSQVQLRELIQQFEHKLRQGLVEGVTLKLILADGVPPIEADAHQLQQVLLALVANAAEAMQDKGGVVTITTSLCTLDARAIKETVLHDEVAPGPFVAIEVRDTGRGMSPETQARAFEPFFTTHFVGRGLGLPAVLGIVRAHHGTISIISAPGHGAVVEVLLPVPPQRAERAQAPVASAATPASGQVLVVDDEPLIRGSIRRILSMRGYSIIEAANGFEGLERYAEHRDSIRVVLLDLSMPGMGGQEALRRLRAADPTVQVLIMSGYAEQEIEGMEGVAGFVEKPFQADALVRRVAEVVARAGKR